MWADGIPNLLIGLREGLEAGLVVSILLAAVRRSPANPSAAPVWLGVTAAVALAMSFGAVLTFYESALSTRAREGFGGVLSVIAVVMVTAMIFWMRRTARSLAGELGAQVDNALRIGVGALALTAFLAVGREGLETALFLWTAVQASGHTVAPLAGAAVGVVLAAGLCVGLYRRAVKINLGAFFSRTGVLLIVVAAGVLAYGLGDLQDAGLLPGHTLTAFDVSHYAAAGSWWMSVISGVTNLAPRMTWLQVAAWLCYAGAVTTLFVRAGRQPGPAKRPAPEQAPVPEPEPVPVPETAADTAEAEETAAEEPAGSVSTAGGDTGTPGSPGTPGTPAGTDAAVPPRSLRPRTVWTVGLTAVLVPALAASALIALAPSSQASAQEVDVTDSSCAPGWKSVRSGAGTFDVTNKSGHSSEVQLLNKSGAIVAEIETLGPGVSQTMTAELSGGTYSWRCLVSGGKDSTSSAVRAGGARGHSGTARSQAVTPVSRAQLSGPTKRYRKYVGPQLASLHRQVGRLQRDIGRSDTGAAREDWLPAQQTWDRIGAAYGSFGDLGDAVDGLPQGLKHGVHDKEFTGLHRLEYGLWHGQSPATLRPVADQLAGSVDKLRKKLPELTVDPTDLPTRAHEILEDSLRFRLTGQADQGSGAAYPETRADVDGTRAVLTELEPLLDARRPHLVHTVQGRLDALESALEATRSDDGGWRSPDATPRAAKQRVQAKLDASLETLAVVPDLLEVPLH